MWGTLWRALGQGGLHTHYLFQPQDASRQSFVSVKMMRRWRDSERLERLPEVTQRVRVKPGLPPQSSLLSESLLPII